MRDQEHEPGEGLSPDEQAYLEGREPSTSETKRVERRRPGWLVVGMIWGTFGLYVIFWVGLHWGEMKRQLRDDQMYPLWHAVSMLVPIYSFFRFHANFRVLNQLLATTRSDHRVQPLIAIGTYLLTSVLVAIPIEDPVLMTLNLLGAVAALSWIIHHGQTGMNAYWDAHPEIATTSQVKLWERLLISAGAGMWSLVVLGMLTGIAQ